MANNQINLTEQELYTVIGETVKTIAENLMLKNRIHLVTESVIKTALNEAIEDVNAKIHELNDQVVAMHDMMVDMQSQKQKQIFQVKGETNRKPKSLFFAKLFTVGELLKDEYGCPTFTVKANNALYMDQVTNVVLSFIKAKGFNCKIDKTDYDKITVTSKGRRYAQDPENTEVWS